MMIFFRKDSLVVGIIKESNKYDRQINEYKPGIDALLESEKIKRRNF